MTKLILKIKLILAYIAIIDDRRPGAKQKYYVAALKEYDSNIKHR